MICQCGTAFFPERKLLLLENLEISFRLRTVAKLEPSTCIFLIGNNVIGSEIKLKTSNLIPYQNKQNLKFWKELCMQINLVILLMLNSILSRDLDLMDVMHSSQEWKQPWILSNLLEERKQSAVCHIEEDLISLLMF